MNFIGLDKRDPASEDDIVLPQSLLILPAGREVRIRLRSLDVIHSFFVASFRVKRDAMPGLATEFTFTPTTPGVFELACAEHCGLGHYRMRGMVEVVPAAEWAAKVTEVPVSDHRAPAGFFSRYIFSLDHRVIGLQYLLTAMGMAILGGLLVGLADRRIVECRHP